MFVRSKTVEKVNSFLDMRSYCAVWRERERERQTDKEHKAWGLIRTVAGIVAKLISQRKLGSSPYLLAPAKPISQGPPQGEQPGTACLTLTAMIAEWVQVKFGDK